MNAAQGRPGGPPGSSPALLGAFGKLDPRILPDMSARVREAANESRNADGQRGGASLATLNA